jgi:acetylglutamate kinase
MIPKVWACADAVNHGVKKAYLLDGTAPRALLLEVFTDDGVGTEIVQ